MTDTTVSAPTTAADVASQLAAQIAAKRSARLMQRVHEAPRKPRRHYASNLNGCARALVYAVTHYKEREPFDLDGVEHMEDGKHEERLLLKELLEDGFDIVEQQIGLDDDRYWVTGRIEGKIRWQGRRVPFEVKRISPWAFDGIQTVDDLKTDEFLLKKLRQFTLYLFIHNEEAGLFIFSDGRGRRKLLVVPLDLALAENILKDLDTANAALKALGGENAVNVAADDPRLPARIPYRSKVCGACSFKRTCLPDMTFGDGAVLGDAELQEAVDTYVANKDAAAAYDKAKEAIKKTVTDKPLVVVGDRIITGEWKERKMKEQPAKPASVTRFWAWDIEGKADNGTD